MATPRTGAPLAEGSGSGFALQMRLVGRVALVFAALATGGLALLSLVVDDSLGLGYRAIVGAGLRSQLRLEHALWFFGLVLFALSGLTTWLLSLYASFRVAGPVFRFERNLEQAIAHGPVKPVPLRSGDLLQREAAALAGAALALRAHYDPLQLALARWRAEPGPQALAEVVSSLKAIDARARL